MKYVSFLIILISSFSLKVVQAQENESLNDFFIAASEGDYNTVYLAINNGINIDSADYDGITALMYAAQAGHLKIANLLLENGADINIKPWNSQTALIASVRAGQFEMTELLIRNSAEIDHKDNFGLTPLLYSIGNNDFYISDMLIYYDANILICDYDGFSPLSIASTVGNDSLVNILIEKNADLNTQDSTGNTALLNACQYGFEEIVDQLIISGCDINITNKEGFSALHIASTYGYSEIVKSLLDAGADIQDSNNVVLSPLLIARSKKHRTTVKHLRKSSTGFLKKPLFDKFIFSIENSFSENDYFPGFRFGLHEINTGTSINLGYSFRYGHSAVLIKEEENLFFQYWEKRHQIYLMLEHRFYLDSDIDSYKGISTGLKEIFTFGSYRGTEVNPESFFITSPMIGMFYTKDFFTIQFDYQYADFRSYEFSPHRFNLSLSFSINMIKPKYKLIEPDWL